MSTSTGSMSPVQPSVTAPPKETSGEGRGRPLTNESVFRIEVSLSSRKSSAIVMKTCARLYSLETIQGQSSIGGPAHTHTYSGNVEWKSVAYGVPCLQVMRETTDHNSPFHIKLVIAEVESGISLWETEVLESSGYNAMQTTFHTFSTKGKTFAVQFANESEAERMLESIHDLFIQKQKAETVSFDKKPNDAIFKKPKTFRKLNKKDISTPCNFKHVSGITVQRTQTCEDELRGTIQRKIRSMSLSSLTNKRIKQHPQTDIVTDERLSRHVRDNSPGAGKKGESGGSMRSRSSSILHRFGSLKLSKKKSYGSVDGGLVIEPQESVDRYTQDNHMSLPSHFKRQTRPPLSSGTFSQDQGMRNRRSPNRNLSLSSGDLLGISSRESRTHPSGSTLERRHTALDPHSPVRRSNQEFNYVPYSTNIAPGHAATLGHYSPTPQEAGQPHHRQFSSDINLNRINPTMYNTVDNGAASRYGPGQHQVGRRSTLAEIQIAPTGNPAMTGHVRRERSASTANLYAGGVTARSYGQVVQGIPTTESTNRSTIISTGNSSIPTPAQIALQQRYTQVASMRPVSEVYYHTPINTPANYLTSANNRSAYQTPFVSNYQTSNNGVANYQTPNNGLIGYQTPSNGLIGYQTPSNGLIGYQTPSNSLVNYQTPVTRHTNGATSTNVETHYKVPSSDRRSPQARTTGADLENPSGIPIAYAVVGVGSNASQSRLNEQVAGDTRLTQVNTHMPTTSNVIKPMNDQRLAVKPRVTPSLSQQGRPREVIQLPTSPTTSMASGGYDVPIPWDRSLPHTPEALQSQQHFQMHLTTQQQQGNKYNVQQQMPQQGMVFDPSEQNGQGVHWSSQGEMGKADPQVSPSHSWSKVDPVPPQTSVYGLQELQAFHAKTLGNDGSTPTTTQTQSNIGQPVNVPVSIEANTQIRSSLQFQPGSKQTYDTLPAVDSDSSLKDSLSSEASSVSLTAMMKALEQFDSLLQPPPATTDQKQFIQTAL